MNRRFFLSILGGAVAAPAVPLPAGAAAAPPLYTRYMYGLAVFHARTRASLSAAELCAKLRVSTPVAQAMMAEMQRSGFLAPVLNGAAGSMRAVSPVRASAGGTGQSYGDAARRFLKPDESIGSVRAASTKADVTETDLPPVLNAQQNVCTCHSAPTNSSED